MLLLRQISAFLEEVQNSCTLKDTAQTVPRALAQLSFPVERDGQEYGATLVLVLFLRFRLHAQLAVRAVEGVLFFDDAGAQLGLVGERLEVVDIGGQRELAVVGAEFFAVGVLLVLWMGEVVLSLLIQIERYLAERALGLVRAGLDVALRKLTRPAGLPVAAVPRAAAVGVVDAGLLDQLQKGCLFGLLRRLKIGLGLLPLGRDQVLGVAEGDRGRGARERGVDSQLELKEHVPLS